MSGQVLSRFYTLTLDRDIALPVGFFVCCPVNWQRICRQGLRLRSQPFPWHPHQSQKGRSGGQPHRQVDRDVQSLIAD